MKHRIAFLEGTPTVTILTIPVCMAFCSLLTAQLMDKQVYLQLNQNTLSRGSELSFHVLGCVAIDKSGRYLATQSTNGMNNISVYDLSGDRLLATLKGHTSIVWAVSFHPSGQFLSSVSQDGTAQIWSSKTWKLVSTVRLGGGGGSAIAWSPDGTLLSVGDRTGGVVTWRFEASKGHLTPFRKRLVLQRRRINGIAFSSDGNRLVSASDDHTVLVWDVMNRRVSRKFQGAGEATSISVVGDNVYWGGNDGKVYSGDPRTGVKTLLCDFNGRSIWSLSPHPSSDHLVVGDSSGYVSIVATTNRKVTSLRVSLLDVVGTAVDTQRNRVYMALRRPADIKKATHVRAQVSNLR